MNLPLTKIAIFGNEYQDAHIEYISLLLNSLTDAGLQVEIQKDFMAYLSGKGLRSGSWAQTETPSPDTGAVVSIGGDGTFLHAAEWVADREIPILGVNSGHLGYLANYSPDEAPGLVADLIEGNLEIERRILLKVEGKEIPADIWPYALNEVALLKDDTSSMINVNTEIDGRYLTDYLADGLLISTPTGSTGYNLSAGGPILQPTLGCLLLSPVAPHSLTMRPLAVSSESHIRAITTSRAGCFRLSLDGRSFSMKSGAEIKITKAGFPMLVMRRADDDFAATLRKKLHWGRR